MSLRDLVTGSDNCSAGDGAGPSNAFAGLANSILGTSSKDQERLREVPGFHGLPGSSEARYVPQKPAEAAQALAEGPSAFPGLLNGPVDNVDKFLEASSSRSRFPMEDWQREFAGSQDNQQRPDGLPQASSALGQSLLFVLSVEEQCKIRDRSTIMARHIFEDRTGLEADAQVDRLLQALHINPHALPRNVDPRADWDPIYANGRTYGDATLRHDAVAQGHLLSGHRPDIDGWADQFAELDLGGAGPDTMATEFLEQQARELAPNFSGPPSGPNVGDTMAREFLRQKFHDASQRSSRPPAALSNDWATEFDAQPGQDWANQFDQAQAQAEPSARGRLAAEQDSMDQTRALAATMASSNDPKFKQSKFLQFVSKMSRGEIILEDNQAKEVAGNANTWAKQFQDQQQNGAAWANDFQHQNLEEAWQERQPSGWADEFSAEHHPPNAWADQFAAEEWADDFVNQHHAAVSDDSREYHFAPDNPFMRDLESFQKGKELFRNGLLSEARLAFEAEVQRNPGNVDAWRLLGTVHAENDNDPQAIAALQKAHSADPTNAEVLLSLGVSYTNELDQRHALDFLMAWLRTIPGQQAAASVPLPNNARERLRAVTDIFKSATRMNAGSADAHVALGVLLNLARDYDGSVGAFRTALQTRTTDYSLWNKLGATLANSARSGEAIDAYQKALDLKPNYMRAWVNMGIAQANLAEYDAAARFYTRALLMNPQASGVWGYLRNVILCSGRTELLQAVEDEDLTTLNQALPLE